MSSAPIQGAPSETAMSSGPTSGGYCLVQCRDVAPVVAVVEGGLFGHGPLGADVARQVLAPADPGAAALGIAEHEVAERLDSGIGAGQAEQACHPGRVDPSLAEADQQCLVDIGHALDRCLPPVHAAEQDRCRLGRAGLDVVDLERHHRVVVGIAAETREVGTTQPQLGQPRLRIGPAAVQLLDGSPVERAPARDVVAVPREGGRSCRREVVVRTSGVGLEGEQFAHRVPQRVEGSKLLRSPRRLALPHPTILPDHSDNR